MNILISILIFLGVIFLLYLNGNRYKKTRQEKTFNTITKHYEEQLNEKIKNIIRKEAHTEELLLTLIILDFVTNAWIADTELYSEIPDEIKRYINQQEYITALGKATAKVLRVYLSEVPTPFDKYL